MKIIELDNKDIERCRSLCNELMAFQQEKAYLAKEAFDLMDFDTRMKASAFNSHKSYTLLIEDEGRELGYIFSTIDYLETRPTSIPDWAPKSESEIQGFYPEWMKFPQYIGCLNNLYLKDELQGSGLGSQLVEMTLEWFKNQGEVKYIMVFISNGNDNAYRFYEKCGFKYSHEVFNGFIKAMYLENTI